MADSKISSRKFIVWVVWTIVFALVVILTAIKKDSDIVILQQCLEYFFKISIWYIGGNVVQKGAFAVADSLKVNKNESED